MTLFLAENTSLPECIRSFHCARIAHLQFFKNIWISFELLSMSYIKSKHTPETQYGINIVQTLVFQLVFFSVKNAILSTRNWCASSNLSCWPFSLVPTVFSISHSKILPRTDARLISSLLHNHLICPFKHWEYNHFHTFYMLQLPSIQMFINSTEKLKPMKNPTYRLKKKCVCLPILLLSKWLTGRYMVFIILSPDSIAW